MRSSIRVMPSMSSSVIGRMRTSSAIGRRIAAMERVPARRCTGHVRRSIGSLLAVAALLSACTISPVSKAVACGSPTALVPHPTSPGLSGAAIGPLLIRGGYPAGAKDATVLGFVHGRPTKMLVLVARDMDSDLTLAGVRCADGQPLRFWLNKGGGGIWSF